MKTGEVVRQTNERGRDDRRRTLLALATALVAAPLATVAQSVRRVFRIGCIPAGSLAPRAHQWDAFRHALRDLGWMEGRNIILEFRSPIRDGDPFDDLAVELVRLNVDVIVATGPAIRAAKRATSTIPIVMSPAADPVAEGLVASLAQPGGNVTGVSIISMDLGGKRLEILREIVPRVARVAVLWGSAGPNIEAQLRSVRDAARTTGVELLELRVTEARELDQAFANASQRHAGAMMVMTDPLSFGLRGRIAELALKHRLPAMYELRSFADAGGLIAYGPSDTEFFRRAAVYVDKILKGAKPADLPIEQPTKIELILNVKAAKALGLTIPPGLQLRADHVIE